MKKARRKTGPKFANRDDWFLLLDSNLVSALEALEESEWPQPYKYNDDFREPEEWYEMPPVEALMLRKSFFECGGWDEPEMILQWRAWDEAATVETSELTLALKSRMDELKSWKNDLFQANGKTWGRLFQALHIRDLEVLWAQPIPEEHRATIFKFLFLLNRYKSSDSDTTFCSNPVPSKQITDQERKDSENSALNINSPKYRDPTSWDEIAWELYEMGFEQVTSSTLRNQFSKFQDAIEDWIRDRWAVKKSEAFLYWKECATYNRGTQK